MRRSSICVYSIALNEEQHVERWFNSSRKADHHLILDTGSEDATVQAARTLGIDANRAHFDPFRFDDARNAALALIPPDIDYVLQLDLDETLEPGWREAFDNAPEADRYTYWLRNGDPRSAWGAVQRQNLHRRRGFRWRHPMHEIITGKPPTYLIDDLVIIHRPDPSKSRAQYLPMLERAAAETPTDARMAYYLAREYYFQNQWVQARAAYQRFLAMPAAWAPERGEACRVMAKMVYPRQVEVWLWKAVAEEPRQREPFVDLARLLHSRQQFDEAFGMIQLAAQRTDEGVYTTDSSCWGQAFDATFEEIRASAH